MKAIQLVLPIVLVLIGAVPSAFAQYSDWNLTVYPGDSSITVTVKGPYGWQQTLPYQDRWNSGWNYGLEQARADWEAHAFEYTSIVASQVTCPSEHTQAFCDGFMATYNEQWNIWVGNYQAGNTQVSQQGASCNIINSPGSSCSLQQQSTQGGN